LPHRKNINLSHLADIIISNFLPDTYEKYLFQNLKMNPTYRQYRDQIPPYLHGQPPAFIKHCLHRQQKANRKFNANSVVSSDDVNGFFTVCGQSGTNRHVDFGKSSGTPSCTCGDWSKTHFPCKHFFAIFIHKSPWNFNSLPKCYLENPYLSTDVDALAQASLLPSSAFANLDMIGDEHTDCVYLMDEQTDGVSLMDEQTDGVSLMDEQTDGVSLMDELTDGVSLTDELLDKHDDVTRLQNHITDYDLKLCVSILFVKLHMVVQKTKACIIRQK